MKYIADNGPHMHSRINLKMNDIIRLAGLLILLSSLVFSLNPNTIWYLNCLLIGLVFYLCNVLESYVVKKKDIKEALKINYNFAFGFIWICLFVPIINNILLLLFCVVTGYFITVGVNKLLDKRILNEGLFISLLMVGIPMLGNIDAPILVLLKNNNPMIIGYIIVSILFLLILLATRNMKWRILLSTIVSIKVLALITLVLGLTTISGLFSFYEPLILILLIILITNRQTPVLQKNGYILGLIIAISYVVTTLLLPVDLAMLITLNLVLGIGSVLDTI